MHDHRSSLTPFALAGALVGALLIFMSTRGAPGGNVALQGVFAAQAQAQTQSSAGGPSLPQGAAEAASAAAGAAAQAAQAAAEATKGWGFSLPSPFGPKAIASGQTLRLAVEIFPLEPEDGGVKVVGRVRNISTGKVTVPISAFVLRDNSAREYMAGGGASADLDPGADVPLELSVPVPPGTPLTLSISLPPDPAVELVLQSQPLP